MGVANQRSIAWGIASAFHRQGAELAFTYQNDRLKENLDELLDTVGGRNAFPTFPCDVQNDEHVLAVFEGVRDRWGRLDAVAHCIAFANRVDLFRPFFFQAEDGIRDKLVTGVQTCALPISRRRCGCSARAPPTPSSWRGRCPRGWPPP